MRGGAGLVSYRHFLMPIMDKPLKNRGKAAEPSPKIISRAAHSISRKEISENALKVLYRLNKAGYQAFLVGGCVHRRAEVVRRRAADLQRRHRHVEAQHLHRPLLGDQEAQQ